MLKSKLTIPHLSRIFQRPRLHGLLRRLAEKRLTLVVGGAGYGKTTLVANALRRQKRKAVWYHLDETDRDFSTFIAYLLHGFQPYLNGEDEILAALRSALRLSVPQRLEILERLIHQLEQTIDFELLLVLDDFHLIQDTPEICESIEFLLKHLPASIHLVLISRVDPAIRISRLRVMDEVAEVHESDMTFTLEEIQGLAADVFNLRLGPASLKQIQAKTRGWAASLVLFFLVLRGKTGEAVESQLEGITGSHRLIFAYLEENVFESQSPFVKEFMMKTALLDKLDPGFCDAYLGIHRSRALLEQLTADHLLTQKNESGDLYVYHHLLKEFLLTRLRKATDDNMLKDLCLKIARLLDEKGDDIAAIQYYLDADEFSLAARRLYDAGDRLFQTGQLNRIRDFLDRFPQTMIASVPGLLYINAKMRSFSGDPLGAISLFNRALDGFQREKTDARVMDCQINLGLNYYYTGHIKEAETYLENCLKTGGGMRTLEITGLLIMIPAILGNAAKADAYAGMAREVLGGLGGPVKRQMETWITFCLSYRLFCAGNFRRAYDLGLDAFRCFANSDQTKVIMPLASLHVALPAYFLGQPQTGLGHAQKGLERLEQMEIQDNQVGWLNYAAALNLSGIGRMDEALAHARTSLELFLRQSCYWGQATVHDLMHFIHRKMGAPDAATRDLDKGFRVLENTDLPFTRAILEIGRLSMLIDDKQLDGVQERLKTVSDNLNGSLFYTFKAQLLSAKLKWYRQDPVRARVYLRTALHMADKHGYRHQLANHAGWIAALIAALPASAIDQPWIRRILDIQKKHSSRDAVNEHPFYGAEKSATAALVERRPAPGIRICLLGHFNIKMGDQDHPLEDLKNAKARMMIKYLAAMHNHGFIHRDEIIELLWPEEDFNKTRKRFNVAVSAIRKFFEPQIRRGQPSAYLKKQGVSFKLDPGDGGGIDVHDFLDQIKKGNRSRDPGQAIHHYLAAQRVYGGPFLVEDPYTQWCRDERRSLQHRYLSVLWKIIGHYHDEQDYANGISYADQYLGVDDSAEHVYQKLMAFHAMAGNRSEIKKVFETCRRVVSDSLDCPLHPKTMDLYRSLLQQT